jgi:hypothetical protein
MSRSGKQKYRWDEPDDMDWEREQRERERRNRKKAKSASRDNRYVQVEDVDHEDEYYD